MRVLSWSNALDRLGIAIVSVLGAFLGLLMATASDIRITPTLLLIFPGLLIGVAVARGLTVTGGIAACALANGVAYGLLLYGWYRFAGALRCRLPHWLGSAGLRVSRAMSHRLY